MRHDYNLPAEWGTFTDAEKCRWYTAERSRRQALRQKREDGMPYLDFLESDVFDRMLRKQQARSGTVDMAEYR